MRAEDEAYILAICRRHEINDCGTCVKADADGNPAEFCFEFKLVLEIVRLRALCDDLRREIRGE